MDSRPTSIGSVQAGGGSRCVRENLGVIKGNNHQIRLQFVQSIKLSLR
jgi:hypothetical protein